MGPRHLPALLALCIAAVLAAPAAVAADVGDVTRVAGDTRIDTAVEIARDTYNQADTAVLATARNYPDALSGSVLAETLSAPLLLVEPDELPSAVVDVMDDLGVTDVVLLGGEVAISATVESQLADQFGDDQVDRITGQTRYHTAVRVAQQAVTAPDTVVLATGEDFPDAVSASALAAVRGWPVILTDRDEIPDVVTSYLDGLATPPTILPIGGDVAISDAVLAQLDADGYNVASRAAGATRYATSHVVASRQLKNDPKVVWVATGADYPDALTAGAAAAASGAALHLTDPTSTDLDGTADLRSYVTDNRACDGSGTLEEANVAGGPVAISTRVLHELSALLSCEPFPEGTPLSDLVAALPVAGEVRDGYDRDLFNHWIDADGDCRDTRDEVLADESRVAVSGCDITSGEWYSYYDGATWTQSSDVDIDHMVPLAEAWDSGARSWNADTRERFANDLGDGRSLVAVTDNVNQSKSDQDPAEWLPNQEVCRYVEEWTAVKTRWSLTVDQTEKNVLVQLVDDCPWTYVEVDKASVGQEPPPDPEPDPDPPPGNCHPSYPDVCIAPPPPDLNCDDIPHRQFRVIYTVSDPDPHDFDRDRDGVGCES